MFRFLLGLLLGALIAYAIARLLPTYALGGSNAPLVFLGLWFVSSIGIWSWPFWRAKWRELREGHPDYRD